MMRAVLFTGAVVARLLATLLVLASGLWAVLALYYQLRLSPMPRTIVCMLWAVFATAAVVLLWRRQAPRAMLSYGVAFALLLAWWVRIVPSDSRDWADDVARHVDPQVRGSIATLQNVRNFDWRSDTNYDARWETRSYDLDRLASVDLALSYWMGPAIAHTLVSFGFDDGRGGTDYLAFSLEIRKERHEEFSAIAGFFKRFELELVAADERDVLRVRTNVRGEDVYMYRLAMTPQARRALFLAYLDSAAQLLEHPRFYDTLTANCTTLVFEMAQHILGGLPLDWRLLASGYLPEYLQHIGGLAAGGDMAVLRAAGRITARAEASDADPQFSQIIRRGIPGMKGATQ